MVQDFYQVLGVGRDASNDEIKDAYRAVSRQSHPDGRNPNPELFLEATQAYRVLADDELRRAYDKVDPAIAREHMHGVNFTQDLRTSYENQTGSVNTTNGVPNGANETRAENVNNDAGANEKRETRTHNEPPGESFKTGFDFFSYFDRGNGTVTDFISQNNKEIQGLFKNETVTETVPEFAFGDLAIGEPELKLMAGYVTLMSADEGTVVNCGDYQLTKTADGISVEVRLGRLQMIEGAGEISIKSTENGFPEYKIVDENTFVKMEDLTANFGVIGVVVPFNLKDYTEKLMDAAGSIYRGEQIGGSRLLDLGVEGMMCFPNSEKMMIGSSRLADEVNNRASIVAQEGTIFNASRREGAQVGGVDRNRRI